MIRILLVDDHASIREPLALMLDFEPDMTVVGRAGSLAEARQCLRGLDAEIAVVDLHLPDGNGVDLIREMRANNAEAAILVLTASHDPVAHVRAFEAGAAGVINKVAPIDAITSAIRRLNAGEPLVAPDALREFLRVVGQRREEERRVTCAFAQLTQREYEVLRSLADGLSDKDIANRLSITAKTVRNHMVSILGKLGVDSRLQALILAVRHGYIVLEKQD